MDSGPSHHLVPHQQKRIEVPRGRKVFDFETLELIRRAKAPGDAKKLGRQVKGFNDSSWTAHRFEIVVRGNEAKFRQHKALRDFIEATGDAVLVEASPRDTIWGIGLSRDRAELVSPREWKRFNLLGFALMAVRESI